MGLPAGTEAMWQELAAPTAAAPQRFSTDELADLPPPAARWLSHVLPEGTPLHRAVLIDMAGEIRIGPRWMPFTARQVLRADKGFVWKPVVGGRLVRFTGADLLGPGDALMEFRLHGLVRVVSAKGPDTARSASGRLAAETVAWLPQAVTPSAGARWRAVDEHRAVVAVDAAGETIEVEMTVDPEGRLVELALERWNGSSKPPAHQRFGGRFGAELEGRRM